MTASTVWTFAFIDTIISTNMIKKTIEATGGADPFILGVFRRGLPHALIMPKGDHRSAPVNEEAPVKKDTKSVIEPVGRNPLWVDEYAPR